MLFTTLEKTEGGYKKDGEEDTVRLSFSGYTQSMIYNTACTHPRIQGENKG